MLQVSTSMAAGWGKSTCPVGGGAGSPKLPAYSTVNPLCILCYNFKHKVHNDFHKGHKVLNQRILPCFARPQLSDEYHFDNFEVVPRQTFFCLCRPHVCGGHGTEHCDQQRVVLPIIRNFRLGGVQYPHPLSFPECASVYPTGKRTPTKHCSGFFKRLRYICWAVAPWLP